MKEFIVIITGAVLLAAVIVDFKTMRIPNPLTFGAIVAGVAMNGVADGIHGVYFALTGVAVGVGVLIIPFMLRGIGGGDVKLMGAVGALMGPGFAFTTFLFGAMAGGVVAVGRLLFLRGERAAVWTRVRSDILLLSAGVAPVAETAPRGFPYAVCIAIGAVVSALLSTYIINWKWAIL